MVTNTKRDTQLHKLDEKAKTTLLQRLIPDFENRQATLIVYNTVSRLVSGDLHHTVNITDIWRDLFSFPSSWIVLGIGTTNWLNRNGEMMPDGTTQHLHFWWADPKTSPQSHVIDLAEPTQEHGDHIADAKSTMLVKTTAEFPFLALAVCNPEQVYVYQIENIPNIHDWLKQTLAKLEMRLAGIQIRGYCQYVKSTAAHYLPEDGLDLSEGYVGDEYFYTSEHDTARWVMNGIFCSDVTILPFISLPSAPVHLHGYQDDHVVGGHIVQAAIQTATVAIYPIDDLILKIHNI